MDDFEHCVANVLSTGNGFMIAERTCLTTSTDESKLKHFLDSNLTYLLLRCKNNQLVTWAVEVNNVSGLKTPLREYKRTCELLYGFMSLTTQLVPGINGVLHSDQWPPTNEEKGKPISVKKRLPDCNLESSDDDEDDTDEMMEDTQNEGVKRKVHHSKTKKTKIEYRFKAKRNLVNNFIRQYREIVENLAPNPDSHAVLRWGITEAVLEKSLNPFRYVPLLPYGITPNEWMHGKVKGKSIEDMTEAMLNHETSLVGNVLYRNTREGYIVSKSDSTPWPTVHLTDIERERPEQEKPDVFVLALFFHLYAGGKMNGSEVTDTHSLQICLSDAVQAALIQETDQRDALNRYKRTLVEITNSRTDFKVIDSFESISDMANCLVVCSETSKYDIPTTYTHPSTGKVVKLAHRKAPDGSDHVVARWTNMVANPPKAIFLESSNVRNAFLLPSVKGNRLVDITGIKELRTESGVSLSEAILTFADRLTDTHALLSTAPSDPYTWGVFVEDDTKLDLTANAAFVETLKVQVACANYVSVGTTPITNEENEKFTACSIVYGDTRFHLVTATPSASDTAFLESLNTKAHLRLLLDLDEPTVSNLLDIAVTKFQFLLSASKGQLGKYLPQIEVLQSKHDTRLHETLHHLFKRGEWKDMKSRENLYSTLYSAAQLSGTLEKNVTDFFNQNNNKTSNVPFYFIKSLFSPFYFIHAYKPNKYTVYKIDEDDLNFIQECIDLTNIINSYNVPALLEYSTVKNDIHLVVHVMHMCHKTMTSADSNIYRHLLKTLKNNLHFIAITYYNIIIPEDLAIGILDYETGESMLTELIEVNLFSLSKPNTTAQTLDVVQHLTELDLSSSMEPLYLQDGCVLFINRAELCRPVLYIYRGAQASKVLSESLFNVWIGANTNNAGFLLLPCNKTYDLPMETDYPTMPSHCLTLVATDAIQEFRSTLPVEIYGSIVKSSTPFPHLQTLLLKWLTDPSSLNARDISYVITQHASAVLHFGSPHHARLFDPSYTSLTQLTNSLPYHISDSLVDHLLLGSNNTYGSLKVTNDRFATLFNNKSS